jgi:hypothetical protein
MKPLRKIAAAVLCSLTLGATLKAGNPVPANHEYASIAARNVFGLNPPSVPATVETAVPLEIITPNGIASISGQKEALFKVAAASKEKAYILREGQSQDGIAVIKVDEKAERVTFNNHGTIQDIPLAVVLDPNYSGHIFIGNHRRHDAPSPQ